MRFGYNRAEVLEFTPRELQMAVMLARTERQSETAERLAIDRLAQHGDNKTVARAMKDLQSDKIWRQR